MKPPSVWMAYLRSLPLYVITQGPAQPPETPPPAEEEDFQYHALLAVLHGFVGFLLVLVSFAVVRTSVRILRMARVQQRARIAKSGRLKRGTVSAAELLSAEDV